jgi:hypothetical protein
MIFYRYLCVREVFVTAPILDPTYFAKDTYQDFIKYVQKKVDLKDKLTKGLMPCLRWPLMDITTSFVMNFPPNLGWEYDLGDIEHLCDLTVFSASKIRYVKGQTEFYNDVIEDTYVLWVEPYETPIDKTPSSTFDEFYAIFTDMEGIDASTEIVSISPSASSFVLNELRTKPTQARFFSPSLVQQIQEPHPYHSPDPHSFIRPRKEIFKDLVNSLIDKKTTDPAPLQKMLSEQLN